MGMDNDVFSNINWQKNGESATKIDIYYIFIQNMTIIH